MRSDVVAISSPAAIEAAARHCRQITQRRARNFYYGLRLLPEPQRSGLYCIYAWMRQADDIVDAAESQSDASVAQRLDSFRAMTDAALRGELPGDDPLWVALTETVQRFELPREPFHAVLDGQQDDLDGREYETFSQLRAYCERVASAVGLICIQIWGCRDPEAKLLAAERGVAFQLTNILRDYAQDFDAGRVYLPREDFVRHSLTPAALRHWSQPIACHAMMMQQIERAESFYAHSAELDAKIPPRFRPTLWAMTAIYRGLLDKMKRDPSKLMFGSRVRLSSFTKATIAVRARWQSRFAGAHHANGAAGP